MAVLAVMLFHAGVAWAGGGLLGVDVFFVLSGYLVTTLLLREHDRTGRIRLRDFWLRRARRLLPALLILLVGVSAWARWANLGTSRGQLRGDALATLLYSANWHYIAAGQNYFTRYGAPSPLLHTWSLSVEEQFYLIWPVLVVLVLRRRGDRWLGWTAGLLAVSSAVLCAALYAIGSSVDRLYYGTDTRMQAIMVGALAASLLSRVRNRDANGVGNIGELEQGRRRSMLGVAALVAIAFLAYCLHGAAGTGAFLYSGGFLAVAVSAGVVVAAAVLHPTAPISRSLAWSPLRYAGRISYGLYLYHWPVFLLLTGPRTGLTGFELLALRFAVTFVAAGLSYRYIERPIRNPSGRPARVHLPHPVRIAALAGAVIATVVAVEVTGPAGIDATATAQNAPPPDYVIAGGASVAHPVRALLVGDSMAMTLSRGLARDSGAWGVSIIDASAVGCDLDPHTTVNVMGTVSLAAQGCPNWRATFSADTARTNPDVAVVLLGRWETIDRLYNGRWTHTGQVDFDRHLRSELNEVVDLLSARGARVVFLTLPYIAQTATQPNGSPWDMNLPSRTDAYNADVRAVVRDHPSKAAVLDLNKLLDPGGHYVSYIGSVRVRDADNEHLSAAGGEWLKPRLLPELVRLGSEHFAASAHLRSSS